mmetsp:Transcript_44286/g.77252  ORF Transcript_44286/g.77252 Transcript_44286/m.77252 type:complete len:219 (-) Transcript_44286:2838-3494(-)
MQLGSKALMTSMQTTSKKSKTMRNSRIGTNPSKTVLMNCMWRSHPRSKLRVGTAIANVQAWQMTTIATLKKKHTTCEKTSAPTDKWRHSLARHRTTATITTTTIKMQCTHASHQKSTYTVPVATNRMLPFRCSNQPCRHRRLFCPSPKPVWQNRLLSRRPATSATVTVHPRRSREATATARAPQATQPIVCRAVPAAAGSAETVESRMQVGLRPTAGG